MSEVAIVDFAGSYERAVPEALDQASAARAISTQGRIIVKPNLLNLSPPPTTTHVDCVAAVVAYCQKHAPKAQIIIAEGSGGASTQEAFRKLGYAEMGRALGVPLIDLDQEKTVSLRHEEAVVFTEIHLPEVILDGFLISVPALKIHSITRVTLGLKNLIGILPEEHYGGYWSYKKSMVHKVDVEQAIVDLNLYRPIDLTVIDAAVGQDVSHLSGPPCEPPVDKIVAGLDPIAVDKVGSELLGVPWQEVEHIVAAARRLKD